MTATIAPPEKPACCGPKPEPAAQAPCCAPKAEPAATSCCGAAKGPSLWSRLDKVWLFIPLLAAGLAVASPDLATETVAFAGAQVAAIAPWLLLAVGLAAAAKASSADRLVARAFSGHPPRMVVLGAVVGALSPFCSCGVVPIIAALLSMGVPLSAVLAFCLASPIMDPAMFAVTAGTLGSDFAIAKTVAAIGVGVIGGFGVMALEARGLFAHPLKAGIGNGGCAASSVRSAKPVHWTFWREADRRAAFGKEALSNALLLGKWLILAYMLEALMIRFVPAESIAGVLGPDNPLAVPMAALVGVPAYLNGYAALPLVAGLIGMGTSKAAAMAFLVGGAVTSVPAAMAVGAIVRPPVFAAYLAFAVLGAMTVSLAYAAWLAF